VGPTEHQVSLQARVLHNDILLLLYVFSVMLNWGKTTFAIVVSFLFLCQCKLKSRYYIKLYEVKGFSVAADRDS
jgi:hypothetical protein